MSANSFKVQDKHFYAYSIFGWSANECLYECIARQVFANRDCYAVFIVDAPIQATYNISGFVPKLFYPDSVYKPGEEVEWDALVSREKSDTEGSSLTMLVEERKGSELLDDYINRLYLTSRSAYQNGAKAPLEISQ